jgi:hypothetical protein
MGGARGGDRWPGRRRAKQRSCRLPSRHSIDAYSFGAAPPSCCPNGAVADLGGRPEHWPGPWRDDRPDRDKPDQPIGELASAAGNLRPCLRAGSNRPARRVGQCGADRPQWREPRAERPTIDALGRSWRSRPARFSSTRRSPRPAATSSSPAWGHRWASGRQPAPGTRGRRNAGWLAHRRRVRRSGHQRRQGSPRSTGPRRAAQRRCPTRVRYNCGPGQSTVSAAPFRIS